MSAVAIEEREDRQTAEAAQALEGLTRVRLAGPLAAFALSNGSGM